MRKNATVVVALIVALALGALGVVTWVAARHLAPPADKTLTPAPTLTTATTPTPTETPSPTATSSLAGLDVLLDPGHSGALVGAGRQVPDGRGRFKDCNNSGTATDSGYPEHTFNWEVATRLRTILEAEGATVTLTRDDDTSMGPCVDARGQASAGHDVVISIHANGSTSRAIKGYFALVSSPPLNEVQGEPSLALARALLHALGEAGFTPSRSYPDQISTRSDIAGLNFAQAPSVLMELGEMRNPEEAALMSSPDGQQRYAEALAEGLRHWAETR